MIFPVADLHALADEMEHQVDRRPRPDWAPRIRAALAPERGSLVGLETALQGIAAAAVLVCDAMVPGVRIEVWGSGDHFGAWAAGPDGPELGHAEATREAWALLAAMLRLIAKREGAGAGVGGGLIPPPAAP